MCSTPINVAGNFNSGLFNNLSDNLFTVCVAGNSALLQVNDSFDINVTATANTTFNRNDVISRSVFVAEQDVNNVDLENALSNSGQGNSSVFSSPLNNVSATPLV